jgi:hypothetical protein
MVDYRHNYCDGELVPVRCPFYGFRWPDNTSDLTHVGGNECGLDVHANGPCRMELEERTVSFDYCDVPVQWKPLLEAFGDQIRFCRPGEAAPISFAQWRTPPLTRNATR